MKDNEHERRARRCVGARDHVPSATTLGARARVAGTAAMRRNDDGGDRFGRRLGRRDAAGRPLVRSRSPVSRAFYDPTARRLPPRAGSQRGRAARDRPLPAVPRRRLHRAASPRCGPRGSPPPRHRPAWLLRSTPGRGQPIPGARESGDHGSGGARAGVRAPRPRSPAAQSLVACGHASFDQAEARRRRLRRLA